MSKFFKTAINKERLMRQFLKAEELNKLKRSKILGRIHDTLLPYEKGIGSEYVKKFRKVLKLPDPKGANGWTSPQRSPEKIKAMREQYKRTGNKLNKKK